MKNVVTAVLLCALAVSTYLISIFWRVSVQEQLQFGRSYLIPLATKPRVYDEPAVAGSFGETTYTHTRNGNRIPVFKQLINSFQHAYASALVSYELGNTLSNLLFRANEYAESIACRNSGTISFYKDTKKDLWNNAVGRSIGKQARLLHLSGAAADTYIVNCVLEASQSNQILNHYEDSRIALLPTPEKFGCPGLTLIQEFRRPALAIELK